MPQPDPRDRPELRQILVGAQGLGKTMLAKNIAHQAVLAGHSALFTTAADLLLDHGGAAAAAGAGSSIDGRCPTARWTQPSRRSGALTGGWGRSSRSSCWC